MTLSPARVAIRYLQRQPTDSVADIQFEVNHDPYHVVAGAIHSRLGLVGSVALTIVWAFDDMQKYLEAGGAKPLPNSMDDDPEVMDREYGSRYMDAYEDLKKLRTRTRQPGLRVLGVDRSWVDRRFRSEAVGERLYLIAIAKAAEEGFAVVPNDVYGGTGVTSPDAKRVWAKIPREGLLAWGKGLPLQAYLQTPLKPRRGHGFQSSRPADRWDGEE